MRSRVWVVPTLAWFGPARGIRLVESRLDAIAAMLDGKSFPTQTSAS